MSARTPFIPQRTASRPAAEQNKPAVSPNPDAFRLNGLLPAPPESVQNTSSNEGSRQQSQRQADPPALLNGINKPLNLSGLSKKKSTQNHSNNSAKSGKPLDDPVAHARSPKSQAPAPRPSSPFFPNSGFAAVHAFRTQSHAHIQKASPLASNDDFSSNNAHIPTSANPAVDSSHATTHVSNRLQYSQAFDPSGLSRASARSSSRPSLEKIHEVAEEDGLLGTFGGQDPATHDNDSRDLAAMDDHEGYPGGFGPGDDHDQHAQHTLRRTVKRIQRPEDDDELEYGGVSKKYKMDANDFGAPPYSRNATPAMPYLHDQGAPAEHQRGRSHSRASSRFEAPHADPVQPDPQPLAQGGTLHRLLGQDLDAYVEAHVEAYEQAKKKWSECSMDEWKAGGDEMASKFTGMLDFVKAHMTSKFALYTSLHCTVAAHRNVLSEREKVLNEARESLVREGGNVVSGKGTVVGASGANDKAQG